MTLKEKFHQWLKTEPFSSKERPTLREAQCGQIADDYAIEFAEWILKQYLSPSNDRLYINEEGNLISVKQLLEIFKKEKGW